VIQSLALDLADARLLDPEALGDDGLDIVNHGMAGADLNPVPPGGGTWPFSQVAGADQGPLWAERINLEAALSDAAADPEAAIPITAAANKVNSCRVDALRLRGACILSTSPRSVLMRFTSFASSSSGPRRLRYV